MPGTIVEKFGYEWDEYREILPLHERQFVEWIQPVPLSFFKGKRFLDAGCGIGRNSLWALKAGAAGGHAFDFDERTVQVARENLSGFPNCSVGFQSIYDLALEGAFDIVFCIGVVHHLEDPRRAVERLARAVKPGGTFILWVYAREGNERYLAWLDPLRRLVTSRLPLGMTRCLASAMTAGLKGYVRLPHRNPYLLQLRARSFRHLEAMVFDQLFPPIARYWTREEVLGLVRGLPLTVEHLTHTNGISWSLVARKENDR
jgi:SAM-dependent methyltransferase